MIIIKGIVAEEVIPQYIVVGEFPAQERGRLPVYSKKHSNTAMECCVGCEKDSPETEKDRRACMRTLNWKWRKHTWDKPPKVCGVQGWILDWANQFTIFFNFLNGWCDYVHVFKGNSNICILHIFLVKI